MRIFKTTTMGKLVFTFLLIICAHTSFAQKVITKHKLVLYPPLRAFFQQNPSIKEAEVSYNFRRPDIRVLKITPLIDSLSKAEYFDLQFQGSLYLLQKKYGQWPLPESVILSAIDKNETGYDVAYKVVRDSIFLTLTYYHFPKDPSGEKWERVFEIPRTQDTLIYAPGTRALEKELAEAIAPISPEERLTDSVFIFRVVMGTDSCVTVYDQFTSENAAYAQKLAAAIDKSRPWCPFYHGGRKLKWYTKFYVKINSDKTVKWDIGQP